jgi:type VI secretion system protein VasD
VLAAACLAILGGCGAKGPPKPVAIDTEVVVSDDLNPDANGRPSPLMLGIYQLKSPDKFSNDDFFSVFNPDSTALGDDLVGREQITLQPGGTRTLELEVDPEAAYLGVVGAFADLENAEWRSVVEIPEKDLLKRINVFSKQRLTITVMERSVTISFSDS